jgi:MtrB/PioB family decaheme-associated outer membrane protein
MKRRAELLATCAALALSAGLASPTLAGPKASPVATAEPMWSYDGYAEVGGRTYLNNPDKKQLGKFFRYEDWSPGAFGNFYFGAHRVGADPFDLTASGFNMGWDDQAYELNLSQPGTYYLTFGWDETPHIYSKDAKTTYGPIGGTVATTLVFPGASIPPAIPAPSQATKNFVDANSSVFDLGFRRDTASATARWTPNDNWDITADYSHMHRHGTQPLSAVTFTTPVGGFGPRRATIQLAKPVDDTTQNGHVKAEYAGTSPWGKSFNVALGYGISVYNNEDKSVIFNNPWNAGAAAVGFPRLNRYSLWPDNQAQSLNLTGGAGLPFNSRYMGTFQYSWLTQNDAFLPSTINPALTLAVLPRGSLDGDARTILSNNVLHTQITPNLESKLRYRYYDYRSKHSPMEIMGLYENPDAVGLTDEDSHPLNFTKQNADAQLLYKPWKWLDVGAIYEWERWKHDEWLDAVNVVTLAEGEFTSTTNENAVKGFFDAKWGWSTLRTSVRYGERRFDGDYIKVTNNALQFRSVDRQNRNSTVVKSSWAINVTDTITVTPSGGYLLYDYPADGVTTIGISSYESWNVGGDIVWTIAPMMALYASYLHEDGARETFQRQVPSPIVYHTQDLNDVFVVGGKVTLIPEKLFLKTSYTYSRGTSKWASDCGPGGCNITPMPVFPDTHNTNQRLDVQAKYMLDDFIMPNAGWAAKPFLKARVVWERNSNDSWQNLEQQLGWSVNPADSTTRQAVFLGMPDPNYNVVVGMLSLGLKW